MCNETHAQSDTVLCCHDNPRRTSTGQELCPNGPTPPEENYGPCYDFCKVCQNGGKGGFCKKTGDGVIHCHCEC